MRYTFVIFGLYLVAVKAGPTAKSAVDVGAEVESVLKEVAHISKDAADKVKNQFENIYLDRLKQVEAALSEIEGLRKINETCVAAEDKNIAEALDAMFKHMEICAARISKMSADIMIEISTPTKQLIFGGYGVLRLNKACKNCRNPIMKSSCYDRLAINGNLYLQVARNSTNAIKATVTKNGLELKDESDDCANWVADVAMIQLRQVRASIDACIKGE